jgi:hypothetical protein
MVTLKTFEWWHSFVLSESHWGSDSIVFSLSLYIQTFTVLVRHVVYLPCSRGVAGGLP